MALEIPSDLIHQLQIGFRKEAGIPSYDPADPSLPPFPSLGEAIAGLDPSLPSYLRCKKCRGGLLRGVQSTLCIYCGADRRRDGLHQAFSFKSTAACRQLLESLELDGSEAVTLDTESNDSSRGRNAPKDRLLLSDLLDMELRWPPEKEEIDNSSKNKVPSISQHAINLAGVDLDTFFSDTKNEITSSVPAVTSEQLTSKPPTINTDSHESSGSDNLNFFNNLKSSHTVVSSANTEDGDLGDSFANWEAAFQSASSGTSAVDSKSFDHIQSSGTGFTIPATAAATFAADSKSIDLFQGSPTDFAGPAIPAVSFAAESKSVDHFGNSSIDEFASPATAPAAFAVESESLDLFQGSTEFGSPATAAAVFATDSQLVDLFQGSSTPSSATQAAVDATVSQQTDGEQETSRKGDSAEPTEEWGQFSSSGNWIQDDIWPDMNTKVSNTPDQFQIISETSDSELKSEVQNMTSASDSLVRDDLWPTGSTKEFHNTKNVNDSDDFFDAWRDFTSSNEAQGAVSNFWSQTSMKVASKEPTSVTKPVDLQDMEFGDFLHSDPFAGALDGQKGFGEVNDLQSDASVSYRMNGTNEKTGADSMVPSTADTDEKCTSDLESSESSVKMLLSKMPDLSFMLETDLSIPKKVDSSGLNS